MGQNGVWCNGSTADFDSVSGGSSPHAPTNFQMRGMRRMGTIYSEYHNHGKRRDSGVGGSVLRKGVGLVRSTQRRWVAEISYHGKRYRCRSYFYERVYSWLLDMREKFND